MAIIRDVNLSIKHDHGKKLAHVTVKVEVVFTLLEVCLMQSCEKIRMFKLKCQLWGDDVFSDDYLYTIPTVFYFPDPTPTTVETKTFTVTVGEGVLDEDWGKDEVYAKVCLYNFLASNQICKKSNVVKHRF